MTASRPCSTAGCPTLSPRPGRCPDCTRAADRARGNFTQRGYGGPDWDKARRVVLARDRICVLCRTRPANTADHYPTSYRELQAQGVTDPHAAHRMRGLCTPCHSSETAQHQPGGWNQR